jgi:hypothetical protein
VRTSEVFHGAEGTVDTVVEVLKDPSGLFQACDCPGTAFKLGKGRWFCPPRDYCKT